MNNKLIINFIVIGIITVFLFLLNGCGNSDKAKANKLEIKIEECIENEDFLGARKLCRELGNTHAGYWSSMDYTEKITRSQVAYLIDKGEYNLAADIAKEDEDIGIYVNLMLDRIAYVYYSDRQNFLYLLSTLTIPSSIGYDVHWNGKSISYEDDFNKIINYYNNVLSNVMSYAKNNDDLTTAISVSKYLKPRYKKVKSRELRWDNYLQKEVYKDVEIWEKNPSDYTEINRIKKELGIK